MTPSKEDSIAAAEQLGPIAQLLCVCLLCCVLALGFLWRPRRKVAGEKCQLIAKNWTPAKFCSACGEESDTVKLCNGCKCVWYCDKECQNKDKKEHTCKKECNRIMKELDKREGKLDVGTELDLGPLPDLPPQEECPICMRVMPIHTKLRTYKACCGKLLCCGCNFQHLMKSKEQAVPQTCAFCRTAVPQSNEAILAQLRKRAELKDPQALLNMAMYCGFGRYGLPVDQAKCIDLLLQSADLGFPDSQYQLG